MVLEQLYASNLERGEGGSERERKREGEREGKRE